MLTSRKRIPSNFDQSSYLSNRDLLRFPTPRPSVLTACLSTRYVIELECRDACGEGMRADAGPNLLIASDPRHRGLLTEPETNRKRKLLFKVNVNPDIIVQWGGES